MTTKLLLSASAVALAIAGIAGSFLPHELLKALGAPTAQPLPLIVQLLGAAYIAFAMMNWTARGSLIGGIYNRPVAIANLVHFVVGAFAVAKLAIDTQAGPALLVIAIVYAAFAVGFAKIFFGSPVTPHPAPVTPDHVAD